MLNRGDDTEPIPDPPSPEEVEAFTKDKENGPTVANFRLQLEKCTPNTPWNKMAAKVFTQDFVEKNWNTCKDKKLVQQAFKQHLRTVINNYAKQQLELTGQAPSQATLDASQAAVRRARRRTVGQSYYAADPR
jgi:hypothetical protein